MWNIKQTSAIMSRIKLTCQFIYSILLLTFNQYDELTIIVYIAYLCRYF